ncbi:MAG: hypothetical protein EBX35_13210 [Planctomycetia bacterium]|nr:hypothetical protein [Planctomycetia bacterium]
MAASAQRTEHRRPDTRSRHPRTIDIVNLFRTGTALQFARGLLASAVLVGTASGEMLPRAVTTGTAAHLAAQTIPGAIGAPGQLQRGPRPESMVPLHVQPVEIRGPAGTLVAIETAEGWSPMVPGPLRIGLVVGQPYRLRIGGLAGREGDELFPSVRILARMAAPPGMDWRFPVEVAIDEDDLSAAFAGSLVRRVVYVACEPEEPDLVPGGWFDVKPGDDAFEVARTLGDPVAELVIGNRLPAPGSVP